MSEYRKDTALIIVTYNQKDITTKILRLLQKQTVIPDIIVVDNFSSDGTKEVIEKEFPKIKVLRTNNNYGGGGGYYIGSRYAYEKGYEWIILSDNDAFPVSRNLIEELLKNADTNTITQPWNVDEDSEEIYHIWPLHYCCYNRKIFLRSKFVLFEFFLYGDDLEYLHRTKKIFSFKKIKNVYYTHPMKRSYLPSRFYFNHRNYLNISLYHLGFIRFCISYIVFINSLFVYKIIGETDYYCFGFKAIEDFLCAINDNATINKKTCIKNKLIISKLDEFISRYNKAFVNVHIKTSSILNLKTYYGTVYKMNNLFKLITSKTMILESLINTEAMLYSYLFNSEVITVEDIDNKKIKYRKYVFPSIIKKYMFLFFYNIKYLFLSIKVFCFAIKIYITRKNIYKFNEYYDNNKLTVFYYED